MKKLFKTLSITLLMSVTFLATSCSKKNNNGPDVPPPTPDGVQKVEYIDASSYEKWTYFSFATGKVVEVSDPKSSMDWDVAFHRGEIRVNGPQNFSGKAGVFMTEGTDFNATIDTKTIDFKANVEALLQVEHGMKAAQEKRQPKTEKQFYVFVGEKVNSYTFFAYNKNSQMGDVKNMYPINNKIFIFKGADGKSVYKLQIKGSIDAEGRKSGFLSFIYQKI
ncbi:HmuY family protein [Porphyromonas sp.]|uniref:HmuY family protein n=1 Tax=Porphyromonas sp. TaxID=1924944 RepID=UPI0026DB3DB0|nr:HmuY family protein [Porphyromonas sp.]MDO4695434.1 HmuY family protein [Porphyromonas sp.]MDO4771251.1 HmuY family protein [Porphyromonas sp.]